MKKLSIFALGVFALLGAGVLHAQSSSPPIVTSISPANDRVPIIPNGSGTAQTRYAAPEQLGATHGYTLNPSTDGLHNSSTASYTFGANISRMIFTFNGTATYGYVTMAANPTDGFEACVWTKSAFTLFYPTANTGQTVADAVTTLAAAGHTCYMYGLSNATWYRTE